MSDAPQSRHAERQSSFGGTKVRLPFRVQPTKAVACTARSSRISGPSTTPRPRDSVATAAYWRLIASLAGAPSVDAVNGDCGYQDRYGAAAAPTIGAPSPSGRDSSLQVVEDHVHAGIYVEGGVVRRDPLFADP